MFALIPRDSVQVLWGGGGRCGPRRDPTIVRPPPRGITESILRLPVRTRRGVDKGDEFYLWVAVLYVRALQLNIKTPNRFIAAQMSEIYQTTITPRQASDWVLEARRRDLLTRPLKEDPHRGQGRIAGELDEKAQLMIAAAIEEELQQWRNMPPMGRVGHPRNALFSVLEQSLQIDDGRDKE